MNQGRQSIAPYRLSTAASKSTIVFVIAESSIHIKFLGYNNNKNNLGAFFKEFSFPITFNLTNQKILPREIPLSHL